MKILLVFEDWKKGCKSVYNASEGEPGDGLTFGPFHHGTTFEAEIQLHKGDEEELEKAMKNGFTPVWAMVLEDSAVVDAAKPPEEPKWRPKTPAEIAMTRFAEMKKIQRES